MRAKRENVQEEKLPSAGALKTQKGGKPTNQKKKIWNGPKIEKRCKEKRQNAIGQNTTTNHRLRAEMLSGDKASWEGSVKTSEPAVLLLRLHHGHRHRPAAPGTHGWWQLPRPCLQPGTGKPPAGFQHPINGQVDIHIQATFISSDSASPL